MKTFYFVDSDGTENVSNIKPHKTSEGFWTVEQNLKSICGDIVIYDALVELPKGTIESLFHVTLTYDSDPIVVV